jgi:hypothetical protein
VFRSTISAATADDAARSDRPQRIGDDLPDAGAFDDDIKRKTNDMGNERSFRPR